MPLNQPFVSALRQLCQIMLAHMHQNYDVMELQLTAITVPALDAHVRLCATTA